MMLLILLGLSIVIGSVAIPWRHVLMALFPPLGSWLEISANESYQAIIYSIRLPRSLLAILVGAGLAISGAALQNLLRNPLAEPALIGVSSGAALMAVLIMFLSSLGLTYVALYSLYLLPLSAFIGGLIAVMVMMKLAHSVYGTSVSAIVLAGIAVNTILGSIIGLLSYLSNDFTLRLVVFWLFGSVAQATWSQVILLFVVLTITIISLWHYAQRMNALMLGESEAWHLGIHVEKIKRKIIILVAITVGATVAFAGVIGFVGLVVPHMVRMRLGSDHRFVLPASILLGSIILLASDMVARNLISGVELPIGIITAMLGGPFFLYLLIKQRNHL